MTMTLVYTEMCNACGKETVHHNRKCTTCESIKIKTAEALENQRWKNLNTNGKLDYLLQRIIKLEKARIEIKY